MEIGYTDLAKEQLKFWQKSENRTIQNKISQILLSILENPYSGIGKPEPLKYQLSGKWSRRISKEDRMVYEIDEENDLLILHSLKGHY
jgi:toxin YoeB